MTDVQPLVFELIGEPTSGKTHTSLLFSDPYLADITLRGKSLMIVKKLFPDDWEGRYSNVKSINGLFQALNDANSKGRKTFIIETGGDLRQMGGKDYLLELQKEKSSRKALHPTEWRQVNDWFKELIEKAVEEYEMNVVITAELKDEWKSGDRTGRRERAGFPRMEYHADLRFLLKIDTEVKEVNPEIVTKRRVAVVAKNGLVDALSSDWTGRIDLPSEDPPNGETYKKIMELTKLPEEVWV